MDTDPRFEDMADDELRELFREYNSTPSNPVASFKAKEIRQELEKRGIVL